MTIFVGSIYAYKGLLMVYNMHALLPPLGAPFLPPFSSFFVVSSSSSLFQMFFLLPLVLVLLPKKRGRDRLLHYHNKQQRQYSLLLAHLSYSSSFFFLSLPFLLMPGKYDAEPQTTTTKSNFASFGAGVLFPSTIKTNEPAETTTTTTNERTGKKAFGCFLAWETRNVNIPALNDSKYIGKTILCSIPLPPSGLSA